MAIFEWLSSFTESKTHSPDASSNLTNLTKLDLRDNQLDALPRTMVMLPNVQLDGNPLQTIPPSIARSDWGQICLFLATIGEDKPLGDEHVFISYVRDNQSEVDQLVGALKAYGIRVWLDRDDIEPGQRWQTVIRSAIKNGAFFIAVFSEEYNARGTTHMNEELTLAIEQLRKRSQDAQWFIPVLISDDVADRDIGAGETLQSLQYVDLQQNWADAIRRIVSVIRESRS